MSPIKGGFARFCAASCFLVGLSGSSGAQAVAPDKAPLVICSEGLHEFQSTLQDIARLDHVGFVVEGEPQPVVLLERAATHSPLPGATVPQGSAVSIRERVNRVAASFDYSASKVGSLFLLRKKHTFPADIADVTPEECYMASVAMGEMLRSLSHDFVPHEQVQLLDGLVSSLTADQWHTMETTHYLRTQGDLSEEQRNMVLSFVLHTYSIAGSGFETTPSLLNPERFPRFSRKTMADGSQTDLGINVTNTFVTVSRVDFFPIVVGIDAGSDDVTMAAEKIAEEDATGKAPAFHIAVTIAAAVQELNERRQAETDLPNVSKSTFHVDSEFAAKPVTLVGESVEAPVDVARAIASVYGLRVQRSLSQPGSYLGSQPGSQPDSLTITRFPIPKLEHPTDAGLIAHQILPAPFLSALRVDEEDVLHAMPVFSTAANQEQIDLMQQKWDRNTQVEQHRLAAIRSAARQLRAVLDILLPPAEAGQPGQPGQHAKTIPMASASPYLQSLFVTYTMNDFIMQMDGILYPPWTVSRFEETSLTFVRDNSDPKKPFVSISINVMDPKESGPGRSVIRTSVHMPLPYPDRTSAP